MLSGQAVGHPAGERPGSQQSAQDARGAREPTCILQVGETLTRKTPRH